jgi:hypothetical protein
MNHFRRAALVACVATLAGSLATTAPAGAMTPKAKPPSAPTALKVVALNTGNGTALRIS